MAKKKSRPIPSARNGAPEQSTKVRIRRAALREFCAHGFSGARVDRIARVARVNIRMIYYFFGSKKGLLDAVLSEIFVQRRAQIVPRFDTVADLLANYFDGYAEDVERVRLLDWEALQAGPRPSPARLTNFRERREVVAERIDAIKDLQARGAIPADLDPNLLYLLFVALAIYPMSFPQSVFIATGEQVASDAFKDKYRRFLRQFARLVFR
jgi:AcrR family transcriptional regulator